MELQTIKKETFCNECGTLAGPGKDAKGVTLVVGGDQFSKRITVCYPCLENLRITIVRHVAELSHRIYTARRDLYDQV